MANSIYIQRLGSTSPNDTWISPMVEDIQVTVGSEFTSIGDMAPMLSTIVDLGNLYTTGSSGQLSKTGLDLRSFLDQAKWQKTNPIEITCSLSFFTEKDAETDVAEKVSNLIALSVLSLDSNGSIIVPGVSLNVLKQISKEEKGETPKFSEQSKLVSVLIPGIIYIKAAFVKTVAPTYSKHTTIKGFPLWSKVDITFSGVSPAMDTDFSNGMKYSWSVYSNSALNEGSLYK